MTRFTVPWVPSLRLHPDGQFGSPLLIALAGVVNTVHAMCADGRIVTLEELSQRVTVDDCIEQLRAVVFVAVEMGVLNVTEIDALSFGGTA